MTEAQVKLVKDILESKGDLAQLLGIAADSTFNDIKKKYRKLAILVHPDKNSAPDASKAFQLLQQTYDQAEAYLKLRDQQQKVNATATVHTQNKDGPSPRQEAQPKPGATPTQQSQETKPPQEKKPSDSGSTSTAAFYFVCPKCHQRLRTFTEYVDMTFNCLACGHTFKMQKPSTGTTPQAQKEPARPKPNLPSSSEEDFTSSSSAFSSSEEERTTPAPPPAASQPAPTPNTAHDERLEKQRRREEIKQQQRGPWTCTKCTALCLSRRVKCSMCGAPRPGLKKKTIKTRSSKHTMPKAPASPASPASPTGQEPSSPTGAPVKHFEPGKEVEVRRRDGRWMKCIVQDVDVAQQYYVVEGTENGATWSKRVSFAGTREPAVVYAMGDTVEALRQNGKWCTCSIKDVDFSAEVYTLQGVSESGATWTKGISFIAGALGLRRPLKSQPETPATPQEPATAPRTSTFAAQPEAKPVKRAGPWSCAKCFLPNQSKSVRCKMCGTARPAAKREPTTVPAAVPQEAEPQREAPKEVPRPAKEVPKQTEKEDDDIKPIPMPKKSKLAAAPTPAPETAPAPAPAPTPAPEARTRSHSSCSSISTTSSSSLPTVAAAKVDKRTTLPKLGDDQPVRREKEKEKEWERAKVREAEQKQFEEKLKEANDAAQKAASDKSNTETELQKLRAQLEEQKQMQREILEKKEREKKEKEEALKQKEDEVRAKEMSMQEREEAMRLEMEEMKKRIEEEMRSKIESELAAEYEKKASRSKEQVEAEKAKIIADQREAQRMQEEEAARKLAQKEEEAAQKLAQKEKELELLKNAKEEEIRTLEKEKEIVQQEAAKRIEDRAAEAEEQLTIAKATYDEQLKSRESELQELSQKELQQNRTIAEEELQEKKAVEQQLQTSIETLQTELSEESEKGKTNLEEKQRMLADLEGKLANVVDEKVDKEAAVAALEDELRTEQDKATNEREERDKRIQDQQEAIALQTANLELLQREMKRKAKLQEAEQRIREEQEKRKERDTQRKVQLAAAKERLTAELSSMQMNVTKLQIEGSELSGDMVVEAALRGKRQMEQQLEELETQLQDQEDREEKLQVLMEETAEAYKKASEDADQLRVQSSTEQKLLASKLKEAQQLLEQEKACATFFAEQLQTQSDDARNKAKREKKEAKRLTEEEQLASENFASQLQLAETEGAKYMRKQYERELKEARGALEEERQCAEFFAQQLQEQSKQLKKLENLKAELEEEKKCAEFFANEVSHERKKRHDMEKVAEILAQTKNQERDEATKQLSVAKQEATEVQIALNDAVADRLTEEKKKDKEMKKLQAEYEKVKIQAETPIYIPVVQVSTQGVQPVGAIAPPPPPPDAVPPPPAHAAESVVPQIEGPPPPQSAPAPPKRQKQKKPKEEPKIIMPRLPRLVKASESQPVPLPELPVVEASPAEAPAPPPPPGAAPTPVTAESFDSDSSDDGSDDEFMKLRKILPGKPAPRVCPFPDSDDDTYGYETGSSSPMFNTSFKGVTYKDREGRALFRCPYCDVGFPEELSSIDLPATCPACYSPFLLLSSMIVMTVDTEEKEKEKAREVEEQDKAARMREDVVQAMGTYNNEISYEERKKRIMADYDRQEKLFSLGERDNSRTEVLLSTVGMAKAVAPPEEESYEQKKARLLRATAQASKSEFIDKVVATEMQRHVEVTSLCACGTAPKGSCVHCEETEAPQQLLPTEKPGKQLCDCGAAELGRCLFCD